MKMQRHLSQFKDKKFECGSGTLFWKRIERKQVTNCLAIELQIYCNPNNKPTQAVLNTIRKYAWWSNGTSNARIVLIQMNNGDHWPQTWQIASSDDLQSLKNQMDKY